MSGAEAQAPVLWPFVVYFFLVIFVTAATLGASYLMGERHHDRSTGAPYECGVAPTGSARLRHSARFYLMAVFFVIFDIEAVFVFAWAVCVRESGWAGYLEMLAFIGILIAGLVYLWRNGALEWGPTGETGRKEEGGRA